MTDKRLFLLGDGPEMEKIKSKAGPNVSFLGFQPASVVRQYLAKARAFIFPSEEDFGIVPVEALACGTPVIAYGKGGALETVVGIDDADNRQPTGLFFHEQNAGAIVRAVNDFESMMGVFDPHHIHAHASYFSIEGFKARFSAEVDRAINKAGLSSPAQGVDVG